MDHTTSSNTLLVWDSNDPAPLGGWTTAVWHRFAYEAEPDVIAMADVIDENAQSLRKRYLAWVYELGSYQVAGGRLVDHLILPSGISFWWLMPFAEKGFASAPVDEAIRLLALDDLVSRLRPECIRIATKNRSLFKAIRALCSARGIRLAIERKPRRELPANFVELYRMLPHPVQALIRMGRTAIPRWRLKKLAPVGWFSGDNAIFLCSYFFNIDQERSAKGSFYSRQWESLPGFLQDKGFRINWLQHYLKTPVAPNPSAALDFAGSLNQQPGRREMHGFVDSYLSVGVVAKVLKNWLRLALLSARLGGVRQAFQPMGAKVSLWYLMKPYWYGALRGSTAVGNLFWVELFDKAMGAIPNQKMGLYLCENQPWERAFVHAWKGHGHGQLVGVVHATVRFWDLRHFNDPRMHREMDNEPGLLPDKIALNGQSAIDAYVEAGNAMERIVRCEALRFLYMASRPHSAGEVRLRRKRVLLLGGVSAEPTNRLLMLLATASKLLSEEYVFDLKPHPACTLDHTTFPFLTVICGSLDQILDDYDVAITANSTSAAVDAYMAGLVVVVVRSGGELNMSPLLGKPDVRFVSSGYEMAAAIREIFDKPTGSGKRDDFFFLDKGLPKWEMLLTELSRQENADSRAG